MLSESVRQVAAGVLLAAAAVMAARVLGLGVARQLATAAARAILQLALVGALVAVVLRHPLLGALFTAGMVTTAALTAGGRLRRRADGPRIRGARRRAAVAIATPALVAVGLLALVGAFAATPRALVPAAGILIGGAMTATTLTGRRLLEALQDDADEVEARLCLGDDVRAATDPLVRRAVVAGVVPAIDQTRTVGLVTLPGTFVGLLLGGASPLEAARVQLVVLLALLAVELAAAVLVAGSIVREATAPGERLRDAAGA